MSSLKLLLFVAISIAMMVSVFARVAEYADNQISEDADYPPIGQDDMAVIFADESASTVLPPDLLHDIVTGDPKNKDAAILYDI